MYMYRKFSTSRSRRQWTRAGVDFLCGEQFTIGEMFLKILIFDFLIFDFFFIHTFRLAVALEVDPQDKQSRTGLEFCVVKN